MRQQFNVLAINMGRIVAVDGDALTPFDYEFVDRAAFSRRHHALLRRGEVGCYLSHFRAISTFLGSGAPSAIICEDDVAIGDDFATILDALEHHASKWDLVKLHATHPAGAITRLTLGGYRLASLTLRHGSAACYAINRRAALKLRDKLLPMTVPYDHEFDRAWKYGYRLRAVLPFPVSRRDFTSTIASTAAVEQNARAANDRLHKPWHQQLGMVAFRGANDIARVAYELAGGGW